MSTFYHLKYNICKKSIFIFYWGSTVKVAVSLPGQDLTFKTLSEVQPYHWTVAYDEFKEKWNGK
jgi:cytidine deaminase